MINTIENVAPDFGKNLEGILQTTRDSDTTNLQEKLCHCCVESNCCRGRGCAGITNRRSSTIQHQPSMLDLFFQVVRFIIAIALWMYIPSVGGMPSTSEANHGSKIPAVVAVAGAALVGGAAVAARADRNNPYASRRAIDVGDREDEMTAEEASMLETPAQVARRTRGAVVGAASKPATNNRKRKQTAQQIREQVEKSRITKEKNRKQREAQQREKEKREAEKAAKAAKNFFVPVSQKRQASHSQDRFPPTDVDIQQSGVDSNDATATTDAPTDVDIQQSGANSNDATTTVGDNHDSITEDNGGAVGTDDEEPFIVEDRHFNINVPSDVVANLEYDEALEEGKNDSDEAPSDGGGVQQKYVEAIQKRIQEEVHTDFEGEKWLLQLLNDNDWWVRKVHAQKIINKLRLKSLKSEYKAYFRDVYVWLPDVRWKDIMKRSMPCCPNCKRNSSVGAHAFRDNHFGRVVVNLTESYYVVSRRYICHDCKRNAQQTKKDIEDSAQEKGFNVVASASADLNYTFMGWDKRILPLFENGRGALFPAFLTWRAGVDKSVIDFMRPLYDAGVRPERLSDLLLELQSKKFTERCIEHEYWVALQKKLRPTGHYETLGEFGDKSKYRGLVPTGKYLARVYKMYHESIRAYLDKEVKKRGAETLHWDVSYKEAKHLCHYRGRPVFKGLVTAMNEVGEVRIQFHIYTDSHEQMKGALEAFKRSTNNLGLPGVRIFFTDNPSGDKKFYTRMLPSLLAQQQKFDAMSNEKPSDMPIYPYEKLTVQVASTPKRINSIITALREDVKEGGRIGLDAEWNRIVNSRGMQIGNSKIQVIQIAYRNSDGDLIVLVLKMGDMNKLPGRLEALLIDDSIDIFGTNVSGDLKRIGTDFNVPDIRSTEQKDRKNVHNLGTYASKRDKVPNGNASLELIAKQVLNISLDKTEQCSDWSGKLRQEQLQYAAIDAAVSLEAGEQLAKIPDLTRRLRPEELIPDRKVDLIPQSGNVTCMATRAATATILKAGVCKCPEGIVYEKKGKKHRYPQPGTGNFALKIDKLYSPGLIVPGYKKEQSGGVVTLKDLEQNHIIVPISMIKEHVKSHPIRATPIDNPNPDDDRAKPASDEPPQKRARRQPTNISQSEGYNFNEPDGNDDDDEHEGYMDNEYECNEEEDDNQLENAEKQLTSDDIKHLHSSIFDNKDIESGKKVLACSNLSEPPSPRDIKNKHSSVVGDPFHAMDRTKVPVRHEAKKAFFVALRDAFFVWNPKKLKELEMRMLESGMSEEDVKNARYFNSQSYRACVDRHVPAPAILYWRVRAVYVTYGKIEDSKTKKPLFNSTAWTKADNVLKEILEGYYSDPPGIELYNKRFNPDGTVMRNKYGMEMIESSRGTNRTEAYHKNLTTTFCSWCTGVEMSDALLRERRHRHNHKVSERRRSGFPIIGHYDVWLVELYQNLVRQNHGLLIYPDMSNSSDYEYTDEKFDTIPIHHQRLDEALKARFEQLDGKSIKLPRDQQYLCEQMGTSLPLLPFSGKEEFKKFAQFTIANDFRSDYDAAAVAWCEHVDGEGILPKLPSHIRTHQDNWERNQRVRECVRRAEAERKRLDELNEKISPTHASESNKRQQQNQSSVGAQNESSQQISVPASVQHDENGNGQPSTAARLLPPNPVHNMQQVALQQNFIQPLWSNIIRPAAAIPVPQPRAIMHTYPNMMVGGFSVGSAPASQSTSNKKKKRGPQKGSKQKKIRGPQPCGRCRKWDGPNKFKCSGRGRNGTKLCNNFFDGDERRERPPCQRCVDNAGGNELFCKGRIDVNICEHFDVNGNAIEETTKKK